MIPLSDPDLRRRSFPFVNVAFITACALVFLYELSIGPNGRDVFFYQYGLIPKELTEGIDYSGLRTPSGTLDIGSGVPPLGNVFTSMFVHGSISHFGFNMLFLWVFGDNVEDRLGHLLYAAFYLVSGVAAALTQVMIDPASTIPVIGASGAIAGVLGGYFLLYPFNRIRTFVVMIFITFIEIPAVFVLGFWIIMQFFSGLGSLGPTAQTGGVAYWAHIGGFVIGFGLIALLKLGLWREPVWAPNRRRRGGWWRGREL